MLYKLARSASYPFTINKVFIERKVQTTKQMNDKFNNGSIFHGFLPSGDSIKQIKRPASIHKIIRVRTSHGKPGKS